MKAGQTLARYKFNDEMLRVLFEGDSPLDLFSFIGDLNNKDQIESFFNGYGVQTASPIDMAELYGHFQEALEFIRKHFLKPQNPEGLDFKIPKEVFALTDVRDLYWLAREEVSTKEKLEVKLWASIVLKVMHTILHINKDLRQNYFSHIQTQIFDRFYKHLDRKDGKLFFISQDQSIEIEDFQTKAKKSRDSLLIKLLHKKESIAEELFDRIGVRIITKTKFDCLRVIKFLHETHIIITQNIKPSRSLNTLIDLNKFRTEYENKLREFEENIITRDQLDKQLVEVTENSLSKNKSRKKNEHTLENYRSMHFTCRQLIRYVDPITAQLEKLRTEAFGDQSKLGKLVQSLDTSSLTKELRFFYPYELQITDIASHLINTEGESSHKHYKKSQLKSTQNRLFKHLLELKVT